MDGNISFTICGLCFSILLTIVFFSKKRLESLENKLYSTLIVTNLFGSIIHILCGIFSPMQGDSISSIVSSKMYCVYLISWLMLFTVYAFVISRRDKNKSEADLKHYYKKVFYAIAVFAAMCIVIIAFLPIEIYNKSGVVYTFGKCVDFIYGVSGICILVIFVCMILNLKRIKEKKYWPIFIFMIIGLGVMGIQALHPELLLMTVMETFLTFLMYFTIENPDMKMIEELKVAREQADKANRAKTDFLSSMSHEIRTPLNAIVGFSDCITTSKTLDEAQENAKDIINASQTLLEIVNGILDISKIEAGKIEIVNSPYKAEETFLGLAKLITPKMNEKALDFSYYIAPDLPQNLYGDHANLKKIVTNLLSNAYKYTEKGFVRYEVNCINTKDLCKLIITVEDSGRGIKKENIDKMFTKFQRLDEDRNTTIEGTGLGLAITKQLIELMGGKIIVHTIYGQGSKFTVVLNQKIDATKVEEETKHIRTTLDLTDERILLVDDNELNLKVATKLLERYKANCITQVSSGFECIDRIKAGEKYDIILLDDMMPKMSGVETLGKLKQLPGFNIPVIALTANAITGMRDKYIQDGFNDYLAKPMEKDQVIQVLNEVLEKGPTEELEIISDNPVITSSENVPHQTLNNPQSVVEEIISSEPIVEKAPTIYPVEEEIEVIGEEEPEVLDDSEPTTTSENIVYDENYLRGQGVDMDKALEFLGDMEMYNMTVQDFLAEVDGKWNNIKTYRDNNDMPNYAIEVHSLKSDCKYLGLMTLADIAYDHELKSKANDVDFVQNDFARLETEFNKTMSLVKEYASHLN